MNLVCILEYEAEKPDRISISFLPELSEISLIDPVGTLNAFNGFCTHPELVLWSFGSCNESPAAKTITTTLEATGMGVSARWLYSCDGG